MGLFGKTDEKTSKERVNEWVSTLRKEFHALDRQIRAIQREEEKVKRSVKESAKKGDVDVCKILAKEIIASRKSVSRIQASKALLNSVQLSLKQQLAVIRMAGPLQKCTDVMKSMQNLCKISEIAGTMQDLSREMMKAGIIEEMVEDTFESALGDDLALEDEADKEVDKLLFELTAGQLGSAPDVVSETLPVGEIEEGIASASTLDDAVIADITKRLESLKS